MERKKESTVEANRKKRRLSGGKVQAVREREVAEEQRKRDEAAVRKFLAKELLPGKPGEVVTNVFQTKVKDKTLLLDKYAARPSRVEETELQQRRRHGDRVRRKLKQRLSKKERKALGCEVTVERSDVEGKVTYAQLLPLHELWLDYCASLVAAESCPYAGQQLVHADLHGAIMTVVESKCPNNVGITGILVQETEKLFKLVTMRNKLKLIPKQESIFSLQVADKVVTIYGKHFCFRSSERAGHRFRSRQTVAL